MSFWLAATIYAFNPFLVLIFLNSYTKEPEKFKADSSSIITAYIAMLIFVFMTFGLHFLLFKLLGKSITFQSYFKVPEEPYMFLPYVLGFLWFIYFFVAKTFAQTHAVFGLLNITIAFTSLFSMYCAMILYLNWFYKS